jgi:hypothetical protein
MKKWKQYLIGVVVMFAVGGTLLPVAPAAAINVFDQCSNNKDSAVCKAQGEDDLGNMIEILINTLLIVLGMIAVVMIVIGGIRYTTSNGDSGSIKSAKDTILYAVIGLIVAIMSYAIVNFVVSQFIAGT